MTTLDTATRIVPVLLLFVTGFLLRRARFLSATTMSELKKLVVTVTLPALMFVAFLSLRLARDELILAGSIFGLCLVLLLLSRLVDRLSAGRWGIRSFMMGGFEAGMLGYALYLSVFGDGALPIFASVDLGQVVFVFVILMPILQSRRVDSTDSAGTRGGAAAAVKGIVQQAAKSPIIWAIAGGLLLGAIGRSVSISPEPFRPIAGFLDIVGNLTAPLIALVIGYELDFSGGVIGKAVAFVFVRKLVLIGTALLGLALVPGIGNLTRFAILTMLLLPPPYVVTLAARDDEKALTAGILSVSTVVSVLAFAAVVLVTGGSI